MFLQSSGEIDQPKKQSHSRDKADAGLLAESEGLGQRPHVALGGRIAVAALSRIGLPTGRGQRKLLD